MVQAIRSLYVSGSEMVRSVPRIRIRVEFARIVDCHDPRRSSPVKRTFVPTGLWVIFKVHPHTAALVHMTLNKGALLTNEKITLF